MNPLLLFATTNWSLQNALAKLLEIERRARLVAEKVVSDAHAEVDSLVMQSEEAIAEWRGRSRSSFVFVYIVR